MAFQLLLDISDRGRTHPMSFRAGDVNLYRYVQNNPLNMTDPSGMKGQVVPGKQFRRIYYKLNGSYHNTENMKELEKHIKYNANGQPIFQPTVDIQILSDETFATIIKGAGGPDSRQTPYGGKKLGDQNGHIVPRELGGNGAKNNMFSQDTEVNLKDYKSFAEKVDIELTRRPLIAKKGIPCPCYPRVELEYTVLNYIVTMVYNQNKIMNDRNLINFPLRPTSFVVNATITPNTWTLSRGFYNP
jgi:hypothetical protein